MQLRRGAFVAAMAAIACVTSLARASGLVFEGAQTIYPPGRTDTNPFESPSVRAASVSRDGALLLAGSTDDLHSLYVRLKPDGSLAWVRTFEQKWPRYAGNYAFEGSDGDYWGLGISYSRDIRDEQRKATKPFEALNLAGQVQYQYLLRMDSTGTAIAQRQLFHPSEHNITCGIDVGSGVVLSGWDQIKVDAPALREGFRIRTLPWIEKTTTDGRVLWEKSISALGNSDIVLYVNWQDQINCKGLSQLPSGTFVWVTTVENAAISESGKTDPQSASEDASGKNLETLLVSVDSSGTERRSAVGKGADRAYLLPLEDGTIWLIEHLRPGIPESVYRLPILLAGPAVRAASKSGGGIRVSKLDGNLRILRTRDLTIPQLNGKLGDAILVGDSEFLVAGCDMEGVQAVTRFGADAGVNEVRKVYEHQSAFQCATFAWTRNPANGDYMLFAANEKDGVRLFSLRLLP